jgi:hypothetical protein
MKYEFQIIFGLGSDQIKLNSQSVCNMGSNGQLSGFNKNSCPKAKI